MGAGDSTEITAHLQATALLEKMVQRVDYGPCLPQAPSPNCQVFPSLDLSILPTHILPVAREKQASLRRVNHDHMALVDVAHEEPVSLSGQY